MPPLPTGACNTCSAQDEKLRPNPFTDEEQCEDCRNTSIIGITDIKSRYKLKDDELDGLKMVTEPQPAFLGGPDRRWYLVEEVEKRAEEQDQKKEAAKKEKEATKREKEVAKQEKEAAKKEKAEAKKSAAATKDIKRKRDTEPDKEEEEDADVQADQPAKRGRGRPPKAGGPKSKKPVANADGPKRGRGRPPKAK